MFLRFGVSSLGSSRGGKVTTKDMEVGMCMLRWPLFLSVRRVRGYHSKGQGLGLAVVRG